MPRKCLHDFLKNQYNKFFLKKEGIYIRQNYSSILEGRYAMITGGSGGIGKAIAKAFILSGADVLITGRDKRKLEQACEELNNIGGSKAKYKMLDISSVENITNFFEKYIYCGNERSPDILVNNAGVMGKDDINSCSEETYNTIMDTNLRGTFFMSKMFCEFLKNNSMRGNVLNVSSSSSKKPGTSPYIISKWGINALTLGLAEIYTKDGIIINGIAPGPSNTHMIGREGNIISFSQSQTGRLVDTVEVGNLSAFLVSDNGRMIVGETVFITGGIGVLSAVK